MSGQDFASTLPNVSSNLLNVVGSFDPAQEITELDLGGGRIVRIATSLLIAEASQPTFSLESAAASYRPTASADGTLIPLVEEQLVVGKQVVETAKVRLRKTVQLYEEALNEPLAIRTFDIERIVLNHPIEVAPHVRQEGDTTIYPLVEEQLILTKQLILKEELHVTRRDTERFDTQVVTLRREHLTVEREPLA